MHFVRMIGRPFVLFDPVSVDHCVYGAMESDQPQNKCFRITEGLVGKHVPAESTAYCSTYSNFGHFVGSKGQRWLVGKHR